MHYIKHRPAIKNKTVAGIFLRLTLEHIFDIITKTEYKFEKIFVTIQNIQHTDSKKFIKRK